MRRLRRSIPIDVANAAIIVRVSQPTDDRSEDLPPRRHTERLRRGDPEEPARASADPTRTRIVYGTAAGLAVSVVVAVGLAALFDIGFWAALGIAALLALGLVLLLAVLVG